jgi:CelD/BcsL family acetyltransferase involved in cellulose biosynthesis
MMSSKNSGLSIEIIASEEAFVAIKSEWDQLVEKSINSSFYSTYPFVYTTWKYYRNENDQLFILVVRRGATLVGIAPFRIESVKLGNIRIIKGIRLKVIRFIAEWGNGDKPSIVTTEEPELIWSRIFQYLNKDYTKWDIISLAEQPENSPVLNQKLLRNIWYSVMVVPDSTSYTISISGTWEEYIKTRGKNTRRTWKNGREKLFNLPEGVCFQCIEDPETMSEALKRFISIEQSGWKKNRDFSIGGNKINERFYEECLVRLAEKNMVAIYLLTSGITDIAAEIIYKNHNIVYFANITYREEYAKYSPGVIMRAEIINSLFGTHYKECDLLGFQSEEKNTLKKNWSTGSQQTIRIQVYKKTLFSLLYINEDSLKHVPQKFMAIMFGTMVDISEFFKGALAYIT